MPSAEIITIGTEILLGEIQDTNSRFLARALRDAGIDLYRQTTVGDNKQRISKAILSAMVESDIIITTGGLGPTVDDPTRDAIALAMGVDTEFRPELWDQIQDRFRRFGHQPTQNNMRQAYIPQGAIAVENQVGTAPSFIIEIDHHAIISLPGVPREMEYLMQNKVLPYLRERYDIKGIIKARILRTAGVGESQIDSLIGDLETFSNPTVGLAAHSGQVDVRITAKAESESEADALIKEVEITVRLRLGDWIYGADQDTLEEIALQIIEERDWKLVIVEAGLGGNMTRRLAKVGSTVFQGGEVLTTRPSPEELLAFTQSYLHSRNAEVGLGVVIYPGERKQDFNMVLITPQETQQLSRSYGGPPQYVSRWALNHSLNLLRKL
jgi:nicotinamide-nucleotide amidase